MGVQKLDYSKLKQEFMASKHNEVSGFFSERGVKYNSRVATNTKGWTKEKKELKAKATEKALARAENKLAKQLEPSSEFLLGNIAKAIELSGRRLEQMEENDRINVKDLSTIRSMNRIQNGQPTTYVKEESDVNQNVRLEGIHIIVGPNLSDNGSINDPKEI